MFLNILHVHINFCACSCFRSYVTSIFYVYYDVLRPLLCPKESVLNVNEFCYVLFSSEGGVFLSKYMFRLTGLRYVEMNTHSNDRDFFVKIFNGTSCSVAVFRQWMEWYCLFLLAVFTKWHNIEIFSMTQQPRMGQGLLIIIRHTTLGRTPGQVISLTQRSLPDNTQCSQETDFHAPEGFGPAIPTSKGPHRPKP
jgi:hypothetical protein